MYTGLLEKLGLNSTEATVYSTMVSLGKATPAELAKAANISRVNAYQVLPKLESLGLISKSTDSKKTEYVLNSPDRLSQLLDTKVEEVSQVKVLFRKAIQKLESKLNLLLDQPIVKYYYGSDGVKGAYMDFLEMTKEKLLFGILHRSSDEMFVKWLDDVLIAERVKRNIFLNLLVTDAASAKPLIDRNKKEKRLIRVVDLPSFPEGTYILIDNQRIMLVTKQTQEADNMGIIIDHPNIAKSLKAVFDLLWE